MKKHLFFSILFLLAFQAGLNAQETKVKAITYDEGGEDVDGVRCGGTERWDCKTLTDTKAPQVNYTPKATSIDSLIHITTPTPGTSEPRITGLEFQVYTVNCTIKALRTETDNDYHLVLNDPNHSTETMIGEVPDPTCSVAASSAHVNQFIAARNWVSTHVGTTTNTNLNIKNVVVTGPAFLDPPHGQSGAAPNNLEIHPIINICFVVQVGVDTIEKPKFTVNVNPTAFSESTNFHVLASSIKLGICNLEIYDINGDKVQTLNLPVLNNNEINYTFHKGNLAPGIYIYRIWSDNSILYEGKIVVQ
jgi:hypothetical protein